ncbi:AraC family transcriptional regulator [Lactiplantibacillus carotarum]|uniref:AraC family transcriptional regulator n=1 Tax=Lactiplantibacillus carotarum TaxID=2993456 RepID=UPI00298EE625|nr:helix-turn-helix domain-containing protein [Lactiplantibacillus carotarum]
MISEQFQQFLTTLGIDLNVVLERAGVPRVVWQEQLELNDGEYWQLMNELDNQLDDPQVVAFGNIENINTFMPSFFAALSAQNGQQGIERLATYKALIGPVQCILNTTNTTTTVRVAATSHDFELPRFTVLTEQLLLVSLLRVGTGQPITPIQIQSKYDYGPTIEAALGCQPTPADVNQITFNNADLTRPFLSANNMMWTYMRPELDRQKLQIESDKSLTANLQALLLKKIPSGEFAIEAVAQALNVSKRTLQRNLKQLGTSFHQQVQLARQSLVGPLMKDPTLSLIEISYLLGYADPESFSRAFKGWTHQSPSAYRAALS